jgi:hypothetical protein
MNTPSKVIDTKRVDRITKAIKRVGVSVIAEAHAITAWSVYKWAKNGFVPNERLDTFCAQTGESPKLVCDPCIAHLMAPGKAGKIGSSDTTKSRGIVKEKM